MGFLLKVPGEGTAESTTSPHSLACISVPLLARLPLQLGPQATGHGATEFGDPQWRGGAHLH